ncbi:hypothetical protein IDJ77_01080 [Mucilaginibacter sp. ZT4R22]|uniref:Uncharacterized protein n=1 Tax=Mucilaginibacter pankratovii TaxID=2772110 RepID=A0ABR7WJW9_9SPHI|nr:hypothetical protein [Mucilaginibacter pankratovii]MBD1362388.1 hypothetical protein [Mucilaginibacter pankratovii]
MDISIIMKLVSIILAISLASERLVTFIKTLVPALNTPDPAPIPPYSTQEKLRRFAVMILAFLAGWGAAAMMAKDPTGFFGNLNVGLDTDSGKILIPCFIVGLMASGGSAFWAKILEYIKAVNEIKGQFATQEKMNTQFKMATMTAMAGGGGAAFKAANLVAPVGAANLATSVIRTVRFNTAFSGGLGTLDIIINGQTLHFDKNEHQDIQLPAGVHTYAVSGAAAQGPGGGVILTITAITGAVISHSPHQYNAGIILPNLHPLMVS